MLKKCPNLYGITVTTYKIPIFDNLKSILKLNDNLACPPEMNLDQV